MRKLIHVLLISLACFATNRAWAQSAIFTYQGRLSVNGSPATGSYDFRFTIYKFESGGEIVAGPKTNTAVQVTGGLFTVPLDFGEQPFLGVNRFLDIRFLDIGVRATGSPTAFTSIQPRVRITSAPYAIAAANVVDGAVTASSLSPGPGAEGQVLKMSNGMLSWGAGGAGGGVSSVGTGQGLIGGPITSSGTISLDSTIVPLLNGNQNFTGSNRFSGVVTATNANNTIAGVFVGNGAGLSNIVAANHNHFGQSWSGIALDGLFLSNTSSLPGSSALTAVSWAANDIAYGLFGQTASTEGIGVEGFAFASSGLSTGVFGESTSPDGTGVYGFGSASSGQPVGVYGEAGAPQGIGVYGIGAAVSGTPVGVYGTVSTPGGYGLYTPNRLYVGQSATIAGNLAAGAFFGNGAGLSNIVATGSAVTLAGDVTGSSGNNTVARIRNVNVATTRPNTGQFLRYNGQLWTPSQVVLGTDVTGTLDDARLSVNVALRNADQSFSGDLTFVSNARLLADSGTANTPSISFASSPSAGIYNPALNVLSLSTAGNERIRIAADGKVGIGRTPTANALEVNGNASKTTASGWLANSDARIKKDVRTVEHALEKIDQVRPVSFRYTDEYRAAHTSIEDKEYLNVVAQEFSKVFPEAVKESGETLDGKPILQVDIHPAAVYSIAAIKELHQLIKAKDDEVTKLKKQNATLEQRLQTLEKAVERLGR